VLPLQAHQVLLVSWLRLISVSLVATLHYLLAHAHILSFGTQEEMPSRSLEITQTSVQAARGEIALEFSIESKTGREKNIRILCVV